MFEHFKHPFERHQLHTFYGRFFTIFDTQNIDMLNSAL